MNIHYNPEWQRLFSIHLSYLVQVTAYTRNCTKATQRQTPDQSGEDVVRWVTHRLQKLPHHCQLFCNRNPTGFQTGKVSSILLLKTCSYSTASVLWWFGVLKLSSLLYVVLQLKVHSYFTATLISVILCFSSRICTTPQVTLLQCFNAVIGTRERNMINHCK